MSSISSSSLATFRKKTGKDTGGPGSGGGARRGSISSMVDIGKFHLSAAEIKIGQRLGTGTFGQVYSGMYFGTRVAVKELFANKLTDDLIVEFHQECNLFKDMRHPNIVLFMGSAFDVGKLYMVMELCEYGSIMNLYTNLERPSKRDVHMGKCLDLANDMAQGGAYLHMHDPPIIHRDLKSENVLVDGNFVAKITDFGQSRFNDEARVMTACGSPLWTAPEVIRGEKVRMRLRPGRAVLEPYHATYPINETYLLIPTNPPLSHFSSTLRKLTSSPSR
jgi:serine/threonine protein kinase